MKALYAVLKEKKTAECFIESSWHLIKERLLRREKKADGKGLNGSLVFRILENEHPYQQKPLKDQKLIIYDVLKSKYRAYQR